MTEEIMFFTERKKDSGMNFDIYLSTITRKDRSRDTRSGGRYLAYEGSKQIIKCRNYMKTLIF